VGGGATLCNTNDSFKYFHKDRKMRGRSAFNLHWLVKQRHPLLDL